MKAIVIRTPGDANVLTMENVVEPKPRSGDAVIAVEACGVCFHDVVVRNGTLKFGIEMPLILGHEVAGRIVALSGDAQGFAVGDRVAVTQRSHICGHCGWCRSAREPLCDDAEFMGDRGLNGGYAEFVCAGVDNLVRIPAGVSAEQASIAACAIGTVLHAVRDVGCVKPAETVLVTGAGGGLGIHAIQIARLSGAWVLAQTTSRAKAERLKDAGAHDVVVVPRGTDFSAEVRRLTDGRGVDCAIDTVGTPLFASTRKSLAKAARWVLVGQITGDFVPFNPAQLFLRNISMLSATSTTRQGLTDTLALIARGAVRPVVADVLPLADAAAAHRLLEAGSVSGRIVLRP